MPELVSILIPVYNAEEWLSATLRSVSSQTWPRWEAIVVDDGSTDNSLSIARSFESKRIKILSKGNQGACAARNCALRHAQGDYIQYLDADDLMDANKLEVQVKRLESEPSRTVAACQWTRFYHQVGDGPHRPVPETWKYPKPIDWFVAQRSGNGTMPLMAWLTPRELVEQAGPWDESLLRNQDGEYFTRVLKHAQRIVFCAETCVYYRSGLPGSVSARQSPEAIRSAYHAAQRIIRTMRELEDTPRVRYACAYFLQNLVYQAYPHVPDVARKAAREVEDLGGSDAVPEGSALFDWFRRTFGWKGALWTRYHYRRLIHALTDKHSNE